MTRRSQMFAFILAAAIPAAGASAQQAPRDSTQNAAATALPAASTAAIAPAPVGPMIRASAVSGVAQDRTQPLVPVAPLSPEMGRNQSRAMMIVGGAALITGAIIGGSPGTIVMVGGAVVGLIGLYDYLQ